MRRLVLFMAALGLVLTSGSPSPAFLSPGPADQALMGSLLTRCRDYAQAAVNFNQMNLRLRCHYRGARWNSSLAYHYRWCVNNRVPADRLTRINQQRAADISRCRGGSGLRRRCRDYARVSVRQNDINRRRRCGYRGGRWSSDRRYHFRWCIRLHIPPDRLNRIVRRRHHALRRCSPCRTRRVCIKGPYYCENRGGQTWCGTAPPVCRDIRVCCRPGQRGCRMRRVCRKGRYYCQNRGGKTWCGTSPPLCRKVRVCCRP